MKATKFQADLASRDAVILTMLMDDLESRSKPDFLSKAISILQWVVTQRKRGLDIIAVNATGEIRRELTTPELDRVLPASGTPFMQTEWTAAEVESFEKLSSGKRPEPKERLIRVMSK